MGTSCSSAISQIVAALASCLGPLISWAILPDSNLGATANWRLPDTNAPNSRAAAAACGAAGALGRRPLAIVQLNQIGNGAGTKLQVVRFFLVMEERRLSSDKSEHVRLLRARAEELRDAAEHMKFREGKSALIILAQSYDRMADELDKPVTMKLHSPVQHRN